MTDLGSVDRKIEWANQQITDLQNRFEFFRESKAYEVVPQPDPNTADRLALCLKVNEPAATDMFTEIALRVGDIAHNLRSALDHLSFRAVANPARLEDIAFPIWRKPDPPTGPQYKSLVLGKIKGASYAVIQHFLTLEPYYGGKDEPLRAVDELDIVDKHRLPITVVGSNEAVNLNFGSMIRATFSEELGQDAPDLWVGLRPANRYPLKDGDVLFGGIDETAIHLQAQPRVEVVLAEPRPFEGEPVVPALTQLSEYVGRVIDSFRPLM